MTTSANKSSIRVAQVLAGAPIGGAENFYTRLVCALAEKSELEQCAFTRKNDYRERAFAQAGVATSLHGFGGPLQLLDRYRYRRALAQWSPDVVLTYMNRATSLTPPGDYQLVARLGHYYDLKYYQHCNHWIGISKGICDYMVAKGLPAKHITHIPNFIDESLVEALPRNSFEMPADVPIILAAGRLHTNKGFDILLQALPSIPDAVLWLAGSGPEESSLRALAESLGITARVRFLGWRNDVNVLMKTADVFVCPSRHEGLGSIVPESWFSECPIVATRSQGPEELIDHGVTGLLIPIDAVDELAQSIHQVLSDSTLAKSLRQQALLQYSNHYTRDIIAQQYVSFFEQLV